MKLILERANEGFISIDEHSRIIHWNPYATHLFGWTEAEVLGKYLYDFIIPERYRKVHKEGMAQFLSTGIGPVLHKTIEIAALHRTKGEFPIELNIFPIKVGTTYTFHAFLRDITERKQAEDHLRQLLEATPDAIVMINQQGKIIFINIQTEKL